MFEKTLKIFASSGSMVMLLLAMNACTERNRPITVGGKSNEDAVGSQQKVAVRFGLSEEMRSHLDKVSAGFENRAGSFLIRLRCDDKGLSLDQALNLPSKSGEVRVEFESKTSIRSELCSGYLIAKGTLAQGFTSAFEFDYQASSDEQILYASGNQIIGKGLVKLEFLQAFQAKDNLPSQVSEQKIRIKFKSLSSPLKVVNLVCNEGKNESVIAMTRLVTEATIVTNEPFEAVWPSDRGALVGCVARAITESGEHRRTGLLSFPPFENGIAELFAAFIEIQKPTETGVVKDANRVRVNGQISDDCDTSAVILDSNGNFRCGVASDGTSGAPSPLQPVIDRLSGQEGLATYLFTDLYESYSDDCTKHSVLINGPDNKMTIDPGMATELEVQITDRYHADATTDPMWGRVTPPTWLEAFHVVVETDSTLDTVYIFRNTVDTFSEFILFSDISATSRIMSQDPDIVNFDGTSCHD